MSKRQFSKEHGAKTIRGIGITFAVIAGILAFIFAPYWFSRLVYCPLDETLIWHVDDMWVMGFLTLIFIAFIGWGLHELFCYLFPKVEDTK